VKSGRIVGSSAVREVYSRSPSHQIDYVGFGGAAHRMAPFRSVRNLSAGGVGLGFAVPSLRRTFSRNSNFSCRTVFRKSVHTHKWWGLPGNESAYSILSKCRTCTPGIEFDWRFRGACRSLIEILLCIAHFVPVKRAAAFLTRRSAVCRDGILATRDAAITCCRCGESRYLDSPLRAFTTQRCPFLALAIVFEHAEAEFSACRIGFDRMPAPQLLRNSAMQGWRAERSAAPRILKECRKYKRWNSDGPVHLLWLRMPRLSTR